MMIKNRKEWKPNVVDTFGLNVVVNDTVDTSVHMFLSKILVTNPESDVVPDVATSLAQPDHLIGTTQENFHSESPKKSQEIVVEVYLLVVKEMILMIIVCLLKRRNICLTKKINKRVVV